MFLFFTELLHYEVVDRYGRWIGRPYDCIAKFDEAYPELTTLIVRRHLFSQEFFVLPWSALQRTGKRFECKHAVENLLPVKSYEEKGRPTLRVNILDQQVVDTFNRKVVRVNDLHFLVINGDIRLAHVDVGARGLVRRLGWEKIVDRCI